MVLLFKVLLNHSSKRQFSVFHCSTYSISCYILRGWLWATFLLRIFQIFSIGERSVLFSGHSKLAEHFVINHNCVNFAVCSQALSRWNKYNFLPNNHCTEGGRFMLRMYIVIKIYGIPGKMQISIPICCYATPHIQTVWVRNHANVTSFSTSISICNQKMDSSVHDTFSHCDKFEIRWDLANATHRRFFAVVRIC